MPVIGFLSATSPAGYRTLLAAFRQGLHEIRLCRGSERGDRISLGRGPIDRLPAMAAELVRSSGGSDCRDRTPAALAAKAATTTIPIVFEAGFDPVQLGLVASLSRPGGNVTGATNWPCKWCRNGWNCCTSWSRQRPSLRSSSTRPIPRLPGPLCATSQEAARARGLHLHVLNAS